MVVKIKKFGKMGWIPDCPSIRDYTLEHKNLQKSPSKKFEELSMDFWSILKEDWVETGQFFVKGG